ncbi:hypothetical protein B0I33_102415 [Prauserella shujinwangii]|uniref:Uncharacterized protein n=1 Tax=Prauserella shujinwangii TaxID=1453103 RepID=A0A2T0M109_9PSEU|nr:hypothetical protein [Prauserella shujinwangii]PRX50296.1 hypothetical protein B0I33_102415 [Prauserella shujinwangii]
MNDVHGDLEATLVRRLEARGFSFEPGARPGDHTVVRAGSLDLFLRPTLSLPADELTEYVTAMAEDLRDEPDPPVDALSLVEIHIEEELTSVDADGRNHATAVGVRRGRGGRAEWFAERAEPAAGHAVPVEDADLEWRADRP